MRADCAKRRDERICLKKDVDHLPRLRVMLFSRGHLQLQMALVSEASEEVHGEDF